jgi:antitoxin component YwqK of YwqJK toxin-antitoxin module
MSKIFIYTFFVIAGFNALSQTFIFQQGNTEYQIMDSIPNAIGSSFNGGERKTSSMYVWRTRDDLKKGEYWKVDSTECGVDTLMYMKFIATGIKHGNWVEWTPKWCSNRTKNWDIGKNHKMSETFYDSGNIKQDTQFDFETGKIPFNQYLYTSNTSNQKEWTENRRFDNHDIHVHSTFRHPNNILQHVDYYANGQVKLTGQFDQEGNSVGDWNYFYDNGEQMASGRFEPIISPLARLYSFWQIPTGYWKYWDSKGRLIAEITFEKMQVKDFKKHQKKDLPIPEINELIKR